MTAVAMPSQTPRSAAPPGAGWRRTGAHDRTGADALACVLQRMATTTAASYDASMARLRLLRARELADRRINPDVRRSSSTTGAACRGRSCACMALPAGPVQFRDLGALFHSRGYNVVIPRLPRHGYRDRMTRDHAKLTVAEYHDLRHRSRRDRPRPGRAPDPGGSVGQRSPGRLERPDAPGRRPRGTHRPVVRSARLAAESDPCADPGPASAAEPLRAMELSETGVADAALHLSALLDTRAGGGVPARRRRASRRRAPPGGAIHSRGHQPGRPRGQQPRVPSGVAPVAAAPLAPGFASTSSDGS